MLGTSSVHDDNMCVACPPGSYAPNATDVANGCQPKVWPTLCPAGTFVSQGESRTESDIVCTACPSGQYTSAPHLGARCQAKNITACGPGVYFATENNSNVADDNKCVGCPPGTFSPTTSGAEKCEAKHPSYCTGAAVYLQVGLSHAANDNFCVPVGKCAAGYFKESQDPGSAGCAPCPPSTYSATLSDATACTPKQTSPATCPIGTHIVHGQVAIRLSPPVFPPPLKAVALCSSACNRPFCAPH